ncbi:tumor necrosis factor receptor superfamily member 5-like isoform X2 [Mytilus californianus]|uniref:tumor necrosis factor receptor superfamily member 5-like isoform X2 n=1 Tax=Mytilus californianus TaxID=6549 RepID=UPI0022450D27|nr:tumor necrosis factor receptor superfamily member 5-like isoform X2 [Mytilus californianus]
MIYRRQNLFYCFVLISFLDSICCNYNKWPSYEKNGKVCFYCGPGFHSVGDCLNSNTQMQCVPCPDGAYQVTSNRANYCTSCTRCEEVVMNHWVSAILSPCTATSNTVCGCIQGYHFTKDQREPARGFCQANSLCSAGHGLVANASNFTDTQCKPCTNGSSYNPAQSLEPCHQCMTSCPNNTEMWYPCNTTHNMACIPDKEVMHVVVESGPSTYLKAGMGSGVGFIVALCTICFIKRRRQGTEKNHQLGNPNNGISLINSDSRNNISLVNRQDVSSILENIRKICLRSGDEIDWDCFFNKFPSTVTVLPDWQQFIRTLFSLSVSGRGQETVNEAEERHEQKLFHSRLFYALNKWKECCYKDNDTVMYGILCEAVITHQRNLQFRPN